MNKLLKEALYLIERQQKEIANLETHFINVHKTDVNLNDETDLFVTTTRAYLKQIEKN